MMQHRFEDISQHVSKEGLVKLDKMAAEAAQIADERESAKQSVARSVAGSGWIIVQVAFGCENAVEKTLADAEIEVCVPMRKGPERKRHGKRIPPVDMPVFTGFVFVYCAPTAKALRGLKTFQNVKAVIMAGEVAVRVSEESINNFKEMAARGEYDWGRPTGRFFEGDKVRISCGPFEGFDVCIEGFGGAGKGDAVVTIDIFGRPTVLNIPLAMLQKV